MSNNTKQQFFAIPQALAIGVLNYLGLQPWAEVNEFIAGLSNLKEVSITAAVEANPVVKSPESGVKVDSKAEE